MARRIVQANGRNYMFSQDDQPPRASRHWMLVRARLLNDVTLQPVAEGVRLESDLPRTTPRIASDGIVGLVAVPKEVFPLLAGRNYTFNLTFHARGFLSQTVAVVIPRVEKATAPPLPVRDDRVLTLGDTINLQQGELLLLGSGPAGPWEEVRATLIGPGVNQVTIRPPLLRDHNVNPEPVVAVIPLKFGPTDLGDVLMVPQP